MILPAVSLNSLDTEIMKMMDRWKEMGDPTQSLPHAASRTLPDWNKQGK
jgi:hypothetical protein